MGVQSTTLFQALGTKMDFLSKRQAVISQNIANADTPGYRPQDLKPLDFKTALSSITGDGAGKTSITPTATNAAHMDAGGSINADNARTGKQKHTYEVAPVGNAVIIEEQMLSAGQTVMDYNLMTNIYQKYVGMIKTAVQS